MKNIIMVLLLLSPISFFAQNNPQREHLPKEQNPQIQIKRLTLALNLTDDQATLVESLLEKHRSNRPQRPKTPKSLSQEQKEAFQEKRLEAQITLQRDMETILNPEQFTQFRDMIEKKAKKRKKHYKMRKH